MAINWSRLRSDNGQDLTEYALIIALVIILCLAAIRLMGTTLQDVLESISSTLTSVLSL